MASVTPLVPGTIGAHTDDDADALHLLTAAAEETEALRRGLRRLPGQLPRLRVWLPAVDVVLTAAVLTVPAGLVGPGSLSPSTAALLGLGWCLALTAAGAWSSRSHGIDRPSIVRAVALTGLGCWVVDALFDPSVGSAHLLVATVVLALMTLLPRLIAVALIGSGRSIRLAIAGDVADVQRMVAELGRASSTRFEAAALCLDPADPDQIGALALDGLPVWSGADQVVEAALASDATAILLSPGRALSPADSRRLTWLAHEAGLEVYVGTGLLDVTPTRTSVVGAGDLSVLHLRTTTAPAPARLLKEVVERMLAALALVVLLPLLAAIGIAIRLDSPGGSLFSQRRVGRGGAPFTMHKFRTMCVDAEQRVDGLADHNEAAGVLFKIHADPRITAVGSFLRRYSLDELPQLFDVLAGRMSLVGPRPALPDEVARYDTDPRRRLAVKPGLTGLWQVSGRSDLSWQDAVRLDLHYVDNWSLGLDVRIVLRTVSAVLIHRGAY